MADFSVILYGHSGQGVRTAGRVISRAGFISKLNVKEWYVREKYQRAGITADYMRFSDKHIETNEHLEKTDFLLVFNKLTNDIVKMCRDDGVIIANSSERIKTSYMSQHKIRCHVVDADQIAATIFGKRFPGPVMAGAFAKISGKMSLKSMKEALKQEISYKTLGKQSFPMHGNSERISKISESQIALEEGYKNVKLR
ncbi:MAG: 2-oxoacid:acceptor oxidoreductase family protein [Candidatus Aenigmarchaeota archaeon]|nr:2-oxoacid:acceptor oxidoreductase family protein [Candidatus Aenigmarchaeota archaeon]